MAEDLSISFKIDSKEAEAGLAAVEKTVGALSSTLKTQLEPSAQAAYDAFERLAKAQGPRAIQKGLVDATIAMEGFKAAADKAAASGQAMPAKVGQAIKAMQADIDAGSKKLGQLKDTMGDVASRANQAGQSFEYLKGAGGGVSGMMSALESSSSGALSAIGKLGIATIGVVGIFGTATMAGKALGEQITKTADSYQKLVDAGTKLRVDTEKTRLAMEAAAKGLIQHGASFAETVRNYDRFIVSQGRVRDEVDKFGKTLAGLNVPKTFNEIENAALAMDAELSGAFKRSAKEGLEWSIKNEKALKDVMEEYRHFGEAVPEHIRKGIDAVDEFNAASKRMAEDQKRVNAETVQIFVDGQKAIAQALRDAAEAARDMAAAIAEEKAAFDAHTAVIDAAIQKTKEFEAAQREGIAFQGQATIIQIQAIEATQEQTDALIELFKAQNSYNDALAHALTAVDQWNNYLAILVDSYQSGTTSLLAYKEALTMFLTQLQQNFGTATGKAKEGLESVIDAVRRLIETAGQGGLSTDQTMGGSLDREMNKP